MVWWVRLWSTYLHGLTTAACLWATTLVPLTMAPHNVSLLNQRMAILASPPLMLAWTQVVHAIQVTSMETR